MKNKLIALLTAVLSSQIALSVSADSLFLPSSCIPKTIGMTVVKSVKPLAIIGYRGQTYHFIAVEGQRKNESVRAVIRRGQACHLIFVDAGEATTLSEGVPIPVAKQIALVAFKNAVKRRGGLPSYQRWFTAQKLSPLAPEDAFALKAIGVQIPASTKILPWSKIVEHEQRIGPT